MKIEKKQFTLLILTLCALAFLIWQVFRLIGDDLSAQDRASFAIAQARHTVIEQKKQILVQTIAPSQPLQHKAKNKKNPYIGLVDQYQLLQMQHKLLSEQLAIAKLRTQISKLHKQNVVLTSDIHTPHFDTNTKPSDYQLVYLAQQDKHWTATVLKNNQYQTIITGGQLTDGSRILAVNKQGVLLKNKKEKILLSFNGIKHFAKKNHLKKIKPIIAKTTPIAKTKITVAKKEIVPTLAEAEQRIYAGHLPDGAKVTSNKAYTIDEILLLELPSNNYTIQLAKDSRLSDLQKLVNRFHLNPRAMLFHFQQNQQTQHVLLLGSYRSKEDAILALAKLPTALKLLTPQVVSLTEIQQMIKSMR